ncbi:jerky protein homolog-like [Diachasma alloeum]|uniref:jerky protein homolog-like n=1 Tax=Diachasma alloeum TaxID=454923 RepID=UPI0007384A18|nr:jerky protein homolog-like [Diachasma alloeum]
MGTPNSQFSHPCRQVPRTSLNSSSVTAAAGFKVQKERLTVMACCNASGTFKLPLMVIGKYAKPRVLKDLKELPVVYNNQKSSLMSAFLFEEWFKNQFVPEVEQYLLSQGLPPKAILLMDNCSAHPANLVVNGIRVEFLPPNTTALMQPMDQGCLQNIKTLYKIQIIAFIMKQLNSGASIPQALKTVTIRELWPEIMEIMASVCPTEAAINVSYTEEHETLINNFYEHVRSHEDYTGMQLGEFNDWINSSPLWMREECWSHEEIIQVVQEEKNGKSEDHIEDDKENQPRNANDSDSAAKELSEAQENLKKVIEFCEKYPHYSKGHLLSLYQVRDAMGTQLLMPKTDPSNSPLN